MIKIWVIIPLIKKHIQNCVFLPKLNCFDICQVKEQEPMKHFKKYTVRPPKDLTSKFERKQIARKKAEEEAAIKNKLLAEEEAELAVSIHFLFLNFEEQFMF